MKKENKNNIIEIQELLIEYPIYLKKEDGEFFWNNKLIPNPINLNDSKYELLTSSVLNIEFMEAKNIPENYTKTSIKIGEKDYTVYQNSNKDY